jgi:hypothetical protein
MQQQKMIDYFFNHVEAKNYPIVIGIFYLLKRANLPNIEQFQKITLDYMDGNLYNKTLAVSAHGYIGEMYHKITKLEDLKAYIDTPYLHKACEVLDKESQERAKQEWRIVPSAHVRYIYNGEAKTGTITSIHTNFIVVNSDVINKTDIINIL